MPIWRVKYDVSFGDDDDRQTWRDQSQADLDDVALVDKPADHNHAERSTLVTDVRTQTQLGALRLYRRWAASIQNLATPPMGLLPMGAAFGRPGQARGRLHLHECTHGDPVVLDCTTTNFSEVTV